MHNLLKYLIDAVGWKWCTWNLITFNLPSTSSQSWHKRYQILFGKFSNRSVATEVSLPDNLVLSYHSVHLVEIALPGQISYSPLRPIYMTITAWGPQLDTPFLCLTCVPLIYYRWCFLHWFHDQMYHRRLCFFRLWNSTIAFFFWCLAKHCVCKQGSY